MFQLTATAEEIANHDKKLALQKKAEIKKSLVDLWNDPDRAKLAKEIVSRQNPEGKLEVRKTPFFFKPKMVEKKTWGNVRKTVGFLHSIFTDYVGIFYKTAKIRRFPGIKSGGSAVKCSASSTKRDLYETIYERSTDNFAS